MYRTFRLPGLSFIGAGKLAEALTKGFISAGTVQIHEISASAPSDKDIYWAKKLGCKVTTDNIKIIQENKVVILAVKPQILPNVLKEIAGDVTPDHLLLSFAAGITLHTMQDVLPPKSRIARLMTNTPVLFREGVSSFSLGKNCTEDDRELIRELMNSVGYCTELKEDLLNTVTGFAGGGPAYTYSFIDAIADGAVLGGMDRDVALKMAAKTVLGAARMVEETKKHPGELKDAVCSGGGSTISGIRVMERGGMRGCVIDAIKAASDRSRELGKNLNETFNGNGKE